MTLSWGAACRRLPLFAVSVLPLSLELHATKACLEETNFFEQFRTRPRWRDSGAAVVDGGSIWIASEYINQTCTYESWLSTNFRCGDTRTQLANWGTRISQLGF